MNYKIVEEWCFNESSVALNTPSISCIVQEYDNSLSSIRGSLILASIPGQPHSNTHSLCIYIRVEQSEKRNAWYLDFLGWWIDRWIHGLQIVRNEIIDESDVHGGQRYRRKPSTRGPTSLSWRDHAKPVDRTESLPFLLALPFLLPSSLSLLFTRVYQYVRSIYFQVASLFLSFSLRGVFEERWLTTITQELREPTLVVTRSFFFLFARSSNNNGKNEWISRRPNRSKWISTWKWKWRIYRERERERKTAMGIF